MRPRDNPFRIDRVHAVPYMPEGWAWDELIDRLDKLRRRAAIVGNEGAGKSTLMKELARRLEIRGFNSIVVCLARDQRVIAPDIKTAMAAAGPRDMIYFDGCEQLSPLAWARFRMRCRRAGGLLVTTHQPGRLSTLIECRPGPDMLQRIVRQLDPQNPATAAEIDALHARHDGNIRLALRELYDQRSGVNMGL